MVGTTHLRLHHCVHLAPILACTRSPSSKSTPSCRSKSTPELLLVHLGSQVGNLTPEMVTYAATDVLIPMLAYQRIAAGKNLTNLPPACFDAARDAQQKQKEARLRAPNRPMPAQTQVPKRPAAATSAVAAPAAAVPFASFAAASVPSHVAASSSAVAAAHAARSGLAGGRGRSAIAAQPELVGERVSAGSDLALGSTRSDAGSECDEARSSRERMRRVGEGPTCEIGHANTVAASSSETPSENKERVCCLLG